MIQLQQLKIKPTTNKNSLQEAISKELGIPAKEIRKIIIDKKSLDARKKPDLFWSYTVRVELEEHLEAKILRKRKNAMTAPEVICYQIPHVGSTPISHSPIVVGMGPAGLFCAYYLALCGLKPIVIERGNDVDTRTKEVASFWDGKELKPESNVLFGEGGAGTFSDGKLNTGVKDKAGRNQMVLELFCKMGANEDILYEGKPHIGTDVLVSVVKNLRSEIIRLGGSVRFGCKLVDLKIEKGMLQSIKIQDRLMKSEENLPCNQLILAIGHSARDTYELLFEKNLCMEAKDFAVGVRVEHMQDLINQSQYGNEYTKRYPNCLPAAPYKLTARSSDQRGVYSFCMCPGGYIVNASSEQGMLAVNGMSYSKRDGKHANSAIIVSIQKSDYPTEHPLAGIAFQRELETKAYQLADGKIPIQFYKDFKECNKKRSLPFKEKEDFSIKGEYAFADVRSIFPETIQNAIVEGMEQFNKVIEGFAAPDALFAGVESRTSAPVRITRGEDFQTNIKGIYPCGEGAGYAGGIMSAAMDGMKVAEAIISQFCPKQ